jgi:hypothetical protein
VAAAFAAKLTDEVIERSVRRLPPEFYSRDGARLVKVLKSRRDVFREAAKEYYLQLADYVDIHFSNKREYAEVHRLNDHEVEVVAWQRDKNSGEPKRDKRVYRRVFEQDETNEIRIYMLGGDDKVVVDGEVQSSIPLRVIGGKGDDELIDHSIVHGHLWGFVPFISSAEHMTSFYDNAGKNLFTAGPGCSVDEDEFVNPPGGITQY